MSAQHATGGSFQGDQPFQEHYDRPSSRSNGTPLGRIVAGVFLGLLAWTVLMAVVGFVFAALVAHSFDDAVNDVTSNETSYRISDACRAVIDAGADPANSTECDNDDTGEILKYQAK